MPTRADDNSNCASTAYWAIGLLRIVATMKLPSSLRGSRPGLYDLESIAGPTRHDARLRWAAHITAIIPPYQARRIIINEG